MQSRQKQTFLTLLIVITLILSTMDLFLTPVFANPITIAVTPDSGSVGTLVTVSGVSEPGSEVGIHWDIIQDPFEAGAGILTTTIADGDGDYEVEITVPESVFGQHSVIAIDESGDEVEAIFIVETKIEITGGSLDGDEGLYDDRITLYGTGFASDADVKITWEGFKFWMESTETDKFGSFCAYFDVPDGLMAGSHTITAADEEDTTITASAVFTLYYVWVKEDGRIYIDTPRMEGEFYYDEDEFYQGYWGFYRNTQDKGVILMNEDYCCSQSGVPGLQILRIKHDGVIYLHDLASHYQNDLYEEVVGFQQMGPTHVQGMIELYTEFGGDLLVTIIVDIYVPLTAEDYYAMVFTITPKVPLDDLAFYNAYDPIRMYSAYYESGLDTIYASDYSRFYPWEGYFAGFASVRPSSKHHDARHDWQDVQILDNLKDYDYNYRDIDRNEDSFRRGGMGLQWDLGSMSAESTASIPIVFVVGEESSSAQHTIPEPFAEGIREGKLWLHDLLPAPGNIILTPDTGGGFSVATVCGGGFMPYAEVNIYFEGVPIVAFTADELGIFQGNFIVPVTEAGLYTVMAIDECGLQASASFEVINIVMAKLLAIETVGDNIYAVVDTEIGEIVTNLAEINALIVAIQGDMVIIQTDIGTITTTLSNIDGRLTAIEGNITIINTTLGTISGNITAIEGSLATIETDIGTVQMDIAAINGRLTSIEGNMATIVTDVGSINISLSNIDALVTLLAGDVAIINTELGKIEVKLDEISPIVTSIRDGVATINTKLGELKLKLVEINATLVAVNRTVATIDVKIDTKSSTIFSKLADIGAKVTDLEGDIATISTDVGSLIGVVTSINGTVATIETDIGKVQLDIADILDGTKTAAGIVVPTYTYATLIFALIAAVAAITLPLYFASKSSENR